MKLPEKPKPIYLFTSRMPAVLLQMLAFRTVSLGITGKIIPEPNILTGTQTQGHISGL
jgi:hypothetical protein